MIYIYSVAAALLTTGLMYGFLVKKGYFVLKEGEHAPLSEENIELPGNDDTTEKQEENSEETEKEETSEEKEEAEEKDEKKDSDKDKKEEKEKIDENGFYNKNQSFILTGVFFVIALLVNYLMYTYTVVVPEQPHPFFFVKVALTIGITGAAAITDYKRRKILNEFIAFGAITRAVIYVLEFIFERATFLYVLKNDIIGFLLGFVLLFVVALISRGGIGYGDVKLFGVIGVMVGSTGLYTTLLLSLVINSIAALGMIAAKKKTFKSTLPMAPFIYAAFIVVCVLGLC